MYNFGIGPFAGLTVESRAGTPGSPQSLPFPAGFLVVDPAIHPFGKEAEWIGYAQNNELPVHQRNQRIGRVARYDRRVSAQPQRVEPVDPVVIMRVGAP